MKEVEPIVKVNATTLFENLKLLKPKTKTNDSITKIGIEINSRHKKTTTSN